MTLGKKAFIATIIISLIIATLVVQMQTVDVAKANMIILPTKPITDPPTLTIQSPINNHSYSKTSAPLNITVTKPTSWGPSGDPSIYYNCGISYIHYILDDTSYSLFEAPLINPIPQDLLPIVSNFSRSLEGLTNGAHSLQVIIYALSQWCPDNSGPYGTSVPPFYFYKMTVTSEIIHFTVGLQPTSTPSPTIAPTSVLTSPPSPSPTLTASLSESASALNYGNTVNFTVTVEGGKAPYTYTWNVEQSSDVVLIETTTSPYYSSNTFGPGSHHVYVEVKDADNNTAKTLTVEFNVLPITDNSASPTQQPTLEPSQTPDRLQVKDFAPVLIPAGIIFLGIVVVSLLVYFRRRR